MIRCPRCSRQHRNADTLAKHARKCVVVPIETLVEMRASLLARGVKPWGINSRIAYGLGISKTNVKVRLWQWDQAQKGASHDDSIAA